MKNLQSIRGMHDALPERMPSWDYLESVFSGLARDYGYREIRTPVVEATELFKRSIGDVTDIVEKEMYSFADRNGEALSLRPEGTAGVVRAVLEHGLLHQAPQRLWYRGAMFRHERPQKGRYRQFHQLGIEALGFHGPEIEAELLALTARLWRRLGLDDLRLELNTLGSAEERLEYRATLLKYLQAHHDRLDPEARARMETNPLRLFDSKNPETQSIMRDAPSLEEHLSPASRAHFESLCAALDALGIAWVHNPRLVRGLDYYSHTVFEWVTSALGAQGTVCAGGRYDGLIEQLGGRPSSAFGLAMGAERLIALLEDAAKVPESPAALAYVLVAEPELFPVAIRAVERARDAVPGAALILHTGGGSMKSQMKKADRSGAAIAVIVAADEWNNGRVAVKSLRGAFDQTTVPEDELGSFLAARGQESNSDCMTTGIRTA